MIVTTGARTRIVRAPVRILKGNKKRPGSAGPSSEVEAGDSNPRPLQCDCSALPTELCPLASRESIEWGSG